MSEGNANSPFVNFKVMTPPLTKDDGAAPFRLPPSKDPRTERCTHEWDGVWGEVGERQHLCRHCNRWIWEHAIIEPPTEGPE